MFFSPLLIERRLFIDLRNCEKSIFRSKKIGIVAFYCSERVGSRGCGPKSAEGGRVIAPDLTNSTGNKNPNYHESVRWAEFAGYNGLWVECKIQRTSAITSLSGALENNMWH